MRLSRRLYQDWIVSLSDLDGFLLVNKPVGCSSFYIIRQLRGITKVKRIGHAGTLDPFASGLLLVAIGRSYTRQLDQFLGSEKQYRVTLTFGKTTNTYDSEGEVTSEADQPIVIDRDDLMATLMTFRGDQLQMPPQFSAKKKQGVRAYQLARKGEVVALDPVPITIQSLDVVSLDLQVAYPTVTVDVRCSKGTYIRSLVHDIGQAMGVGAVATALVRTHIGHLDVHDAISLQDATKESVQMALKQAL